MQIWYILVHTFIIAQRQQDSRTSYIRSPARVSVCFNALVSQFVTQCFLLRVNNFDRIGPIYFVEATVSNISLLFLIIYLVRSCNPFVLLCPSIIENGQKMVY